MCFSITLLYRTFTYPLTQNMSSFTKVHISSDQNMPFFKGSSTENSHIFPHKPLLSKTLPQNIHISSHTKQVFSITLLYRQFFDPLTQNMSLCMPSFARNHISSHQTHALFQWLFRALPHKIQFTNLPTQTMPSFKGSSTDNSHIFPHKPCLVSKTLPQKIHILSRNRCIFTCLLSIKQRQHM